MQRPIYRSLAQVHVHRRMNSGYTTRAYCLEMYLLHEAFMQEDAIRGYYQCLQYAIGKRLDAKSVNKSTDKSTWEQMQVAMYEATSTK